MKTSEKPLSVDEYIAGFPINIQLRLQKIRSLTKEAAPEANEKISYGMPAFILYGMLLYFAAHTKHIGLYPFSSAIESFREELSIYKTAKGSIQFPHDKPLPAKLISRIIDFRVAENKIKGEFKDTLKKRR